MTIRRGYPVHNGLLGMGDDGDQPAPSVYPVAAGPQPTAETIAQNAAADQSSAIAALQQQTSATADVVASILASSPSVQTTPGVAAASTVSQSSLTTILLIAGFGLAVVFAMKD